MAVSEKSAKIGYNPGMKLEQFKKITARRLGLTMAAVPAVVLVGGHLHCGQGWAQLGLALFVPAAAGAAAGLMWRYRLYGWVGGTICGLLVGTLASLQLLLGEAFVQECFVSQATFLFFLALGLLLGAIAEFIRLLHHIVHAHEAPPPGAGPAGPQK